MNSRLLLLPLARSSIHTTVTTTANVTTQVTRASHALDVKQPSSQERLTFAEECDRAGVRASLATVGAGNMARALISGFVSAELLQPPSIGVCDPLDKSLLPFARLGCSVDTDNGTILGDNHDGICLLAVKPQYVKQVMASNAQHIARSGIVISVVAGLTIESLRGMMSSTSPSPVIIRAMPNTPALVGCGATVFACSHDAQPHHATIASSLFSTVGTCHQVEEAAINAVTGLSGSGPAYVFTVIDALADGGVKMGLARDLSTHLAAQTVMGAAQMVLSTGESPGTLRGQVCSPGGTTIAGVHALEVHAVRNAFMCAVEAAVKRAHELGKDQ